MKTDLVNLTIDGIAVSVPKDTLVIRAAEQVGVQIPRFCDHPLLEPVGACRQCLVDIPDAGNGRPFPKPQASCTLPVAEGMVVNTQATSEVADKAQQGIMEFLLINHPLDCPVCDKGGECPLQNQAMSNGRGESRFAVSGGVKRTYPKPINISAQVLLDRERCVLCARCTRFSEEIAGDPFIALIERGALQQVGIYEKEPFESYFSGNTIQICPVGALTSAEYRFRSRPFDLVSTPSVAEHDACGSAIRVDHRRGKVMRRLAGNDPEVNEEWITDKDRFAFHYATADDRITYPQVRDDDGSLRPASWPEAFAVAARGLAEAGASRRADRRPDHRRGRLRLQQVRPRRPRHQRHRLPLAAAVGRGDLVPRVRGRAPPGADVRRPRGRLDRRPRRARARGRGRRDLPAPAQGHSGRAAPASSRSRRSPRAACRSSTASWSRPSPAARRSPCRTCSATPTTASTATPSSWSASGSPPRRVRSAPPPRSPPRPAPELAWVPRRAGDRGAVETGCLPTLLPGGRPVADAAARVDAATTWGVDGLPETPGRDADQIVAAVNAGEVHGLVVGGVDPDDTADPAAFRAALDRASFVVALELRGSDVTRVADVVFPVAPVSDKPGMFVNWEGRPRPFEAVFSVPSSLPDLRILAGIAEELAELGDGGALGFRTVEEARSQMEEMGPWDGDRAALEPVQAHDVSDPGVTLATWKQLLDNGTMQDGDDNLRATARVPVARVSANVYDALGPSITLTGDRGSVTLPAVIAEMADDVVWVPANSTGRGLLADVGLPGSTVTLRGADQ